MHSDYVADLALLPDGGDGFTILSASTDKTLKITKYSTSVNNE